MFYDKLDIPLEVLENLEDLDSNLFEAAVAVADMAVAIQASSFLSVELTEEAKH